MSMPKLQSLAVRGYECIPTRNDAARRRQAAYRLLRGNQIHTHAQKNADSSLVVASFSFVRHRRRQVCALLSLPAYPGRAARLIWRAVEPRSHTVLLVSCSSQRHVSWQHGVGYQQHVPSRSCSASALQLPQGRYSSSRHHRHVNASTMMFASSVLDQQGSARRSASSRHAQHSICAHPAPCAFLCCATSSSTRSSLPLFLPTYLPRPHRSLADSVQLCKEAERDFSVCIIEKGSTVGAHVLSGNVFEPTALEELYPGWAAKKEAGEAPFNDLPLHTRVSADRFYLLTQRRALRLPTPAAMRNVRRGNYVISLRCVCVGR